MTIRRTWRYLWVPPSLWQLVRWIKWRTCDVGEANEGFENELWRRWSNGRVGEWAALLILQPFRHFTYVTTHSPTIPSFYLRHSSFSNPSVASPTSQLILQPFRRFTYVTTHSPTLPSLYLGHSSFSNPSVALPTLQLILQSFRCFTYVTVHSPTLRLLLLRHKLFTQFTWRATMTSRDVGRACLTHHHRGEYNEII